VSKIFFNGEIVWDKSYLPSEAKARQILLSTIKRTSEGMECALSAGIDIEASEGRFHVVLSSDRVESERISR
jgi:hypothetical protein